MRLALQRSGYDAPGTPLNPTRGQLISAIRDFGARLNAAQDNGIGVFHYAGFGDSVDGVNYLYPADFGPAVNAQTLATRAVSLPSIVETLNAARPRAVIVLLDTCTTSSRADFEPQAGGGMILVAYASSPGEGAGEDQYGGYFTQAFVHEMLQPERRSLQSVLTAAASRVRAATRGRQTPWFQSTLNSPIFFRDGVQGPEQMQPMSPISPLILNPDGGNAR